MKRGSRIHFMTVAAPLVSVMFMCGDVLAAPIHSPSDKVAAFRGEYVRLRNIDPSTNDRGVRPLWQDLATRMDSFVRLQANKREFSQIRLKVDLIALLLRLYRVDRKSSHLERAGALSDELLPLAPTLEGGEVIAEQLRDELLLTAADVAIAQGDESAAESVLKQIATPRFRKSKIQRLMSLKNGTFSDFTPSPDLETPRVLRVSPPKATKSQSRLKKLVVLDPGHGGDDAGAVGAEGLLEKEVTLDIAKRVKEKLQARGVRVVMTRESDEFVPLARRTNLANHLSANVFVSIHNNASPSKKLDGIESYYLDNTDDQAGKKLAERENSEGMSGAATDIDFMLSDLIQTGKLEDSITLTKVIDAAIGHSLVSEGVRLRGVKKAPFFVLVGAHMPCTLVELLFIDNQQDARRMARAQFREKLATSIAAGIYSFITPQVSLSNGSGTSVRGRGR